ncbi:MAG: beta-ketoacyl-[acyl-carrier-protein] synthase II [Flavobacteriaceae bacterium]|nr:beta-ketoacyl-[acyl-carrier-protein] synthase II [Flavobacteriaceae bacterium]
MQLKRVVVTGMGAVTPVGNTLDQYWNALLAGKSGAAEITHFDASKFKTQFACEIKDFDPLDFFDRKDARKLDRFTQYGAVAADQAIADSALDKEALDKFRVGVIWGAGIGGLETFQNEVLNFASGDGTPRFNPFFIPKMIADIAPGYISIKNGFMGPNYTTVSACASSANAIIDALNTIRLGTCDVVVTGGSEAAVTIAGVGGFNAMHALSTRNDSPQTASRPFDAERDGFVLGEGGGALVLEDLDHALKRGAKIYAEVIGGGLSSDAYHMTAPHPEGVGVVRVMENCLRDAGIEAKDVDAINTHGTSTPLGDVAELKAISKVFGAHASHISINSTKSMTGHLLGAAGAVEAISSVMSIREGTIPPTINHVNVDENIDSSLDLTLNSPTKREVTIAMSNTFGFGGHNACVVLKKYTD